MSQIEEFFRICPACGRRFHIRLVGKELIGEKREVEHVNRPHYAPGVPIVPSQAGLTYLEENVPIVVDIKDFQYSYRCSHCGHTWSEVRTKE